MENVLNALQLEITSTEKHLANLTGVQNKTVEEYQLLKDLQNLLRDLNKAFLMLEKY
jgi:hypothetical protein